MALRIIVSLDNWEKELLRSMEKMFGKAITPPEPTSDHDLLGTVQSWSWAVKLRRDMNDVINGEEDQRGHKGKPQRVWEMLRQKLSTKSGPTLGLDSYSCHSRWTQMLMDNPDFRQLNGLQVPDLDFNDLVRPKKEDKEYWDIVAGLRHFKASEQFLPPKEDSSNHGGADLRELVTLLCPDLAAEIPGNLREEETERDAEQAGHKESGEEKGKVRAQDQWKEDGVLGQAQVNRIPVLDRGFISISDGFETWSLTQTVASMHRWRLHELNPGWTPTIVQEPLIPFTFADYLEYIPLDHLEHLDILSTEYTFSWKPNKVRILDHHLFTEEEVFKYCVDKGFEFPEFREDGRIVFIASALTTEELRRNRQNLEILYNDCAITVDPTTKTPYILQTKPGIKFRKLFKESGLQAARAHFRMIADKHRLERKLQLKDILPNVDVSIEWLKEEKYEGIVDAIPFSEIVITKEWVSGQNGEVHFAQWQCPQKIDMAESQTQDVVLKRVWPPGERSRAKLLRELELSIDVSATRPVGSMAVYGLTREPSIQQSQGTVFLVSKRAQMVNEYLDRKLSGKVDDWDTIAFLFRDLAASLENIHENEIVHRDIHMGNVIVQEYPTPDDPYDLTGLELVIIDLGESRRASLLMQQCRNNYGNEEYWAPEVKNRKHFSFASDIYAAGYLMKEMLRRRCEIASEKSAGQASMIPKLLWDIVVKCLAKEASKRPTARDLHGDLDNLIGKFFVLGHESQNDLTGEPPVTQEQEFCSPSGMVIFENTPFVDFDQHFKSWDSGLEKSVTFDSDDFW